MTALTGKDDERIARIRQALQDSNLDALVVSLPRHVLMLTGYAPVIGTSLAVCTREEGIGLLAPEDERQFAEQSWADQIDYFQPSSLHELQPLPQVVLPALQQLSRKLGLARGRIGLGSGPASQPSCYSCVNVYGASLRQMLARALPEANLMEAGDTLAKLESVKTAREISHIRTACSVAAAAYEQGKGLIEVGVSEMGLAAGFSAEFTLAAASAALDRQHAFIYCMSGPNAARARFAYAHSTARRIGRNDQVLVHCNASVNGYWTDITRTYALGDTSATAARLFSVVLQARDAALAAVAPGVKARDVDMAARQVIARNGFAQGFTHSAGHGVGFGAIDALAIPRLHPESADLLESGMVFNLEPAIYLDGTAGVRHCEMVAVSQSGAELLTPFQSGLDQLSIPRRRKAA